MYFSLLWQPSAWSKFDISVLANIFAVLEFLTFNILPLNGRIAWKFRSLACFADPPAESPSTINNSVPSTFELVQSASFPGKRIFLVALCLPTSRFWSSKFFSLILPSIKLRIEFDAFGCWLNQSSTDFAIEASQYFWI